MGQEQCVQRRIRERGTSDLDKVGGKGSHREIVAVAVAVAAAAAVDIAGSRGLS